MSRSPQLRLQDIIEACEQVAEYVGGYDARRFAADNQTRDAVVRQFEIIGEGDQETLEILKAEILKTERGKTVERAEIQKAEILK